jgi:hypothetical protein
MPAVGNLVLPSMIVKPIYVTFSGASNTDPELQFATYNEFGGKLSEGTFKLSDPISKVNETESGSGIAMLVYPNPASHTATITINLDYFVTNATINIYDLFGRKVGNILENGNLEKGSHIFNFNINDLSSGAYYIEINSGNMKETLNFNITK